MAFNTGNSVGSTDARDLSDNAENFDAAVNNVSSATWVDRLGKTRTSLAGQIGYIGTGTDGAIEDYVSGLELTTHSTIIRYNGEFYRPSASAVLPYTTTATLPDVDSNLTSIGDANLRQDLTGDPANGLGAALVNGSVIRVGSVAEGFAGRTGTLGYQYSVISWHLGGAAQVNPKGGDTFTYKPDVAKSEHNGVTVISPTVPAVSAQTGATLADRRDAFLAAAGETDSTGLGAFVRSYEVMDVTKAGAVINDNTVDDLGAFNAALDVSLSVFVPDADGYFLSAPITSLQNMELFGEGEILADRERAAKIYAPAGFLLNSTGGRHRVSIRNLWALGDGRATAGIKAVDGPFGGLFEGNYFDGFDISVENNFAFLADFIRNKFNDTNIGLYLSTTNEVNVLRNFFSSSCIKPIDTYNLEPGTGGTRAAFPITVSGNNFNLGGFTVPSVLSGQVNYERNYVEAFGAPAGPYVFEYVAMRFANGTLNVTDNHVNGQGNMASLIQIYSDNSAGSVIQGEIKRNYLRGSTEEAIVFGEKAGFFGNVTGIEIEKNTATVVPYVRYPSADYGTPPQNWGLEYTAGTLDVSGTSYVSIPFTLKSGFLPIDLQSSGAIWNVSKSGMYWVMVTITQKYSSDFRISQMRITVNGAQVVDAVDSLSVAVAGDNYKTATLTLALPLVNGDDVQIQARNGDTINRAEMTIRELPNTQIYEVV